mmetsp:Transcript_38410/g.94446  ORF Transcript_38410/g.94446 Transcript_38410/m.94446 type:complete len:249 (+) Transcript_38410:2315-3061(+)
MALSPCLGSWEDAYSLNAVMLLHSLQVPFALDAYTPVVAQQLPKSGRSFRIVPEVGDFQRSLPIAIACLQISTGSCKSAHSGRRAIRSCPMQGSAHVPVSYVHVRPRVDQDLKDLRPPLPGRVVHGRLIELPADRVDVHPRVYQGPHGRLVASLCGCPHGVVHLLDLLLAHLLPPLLVQVLLHLLLLVAHLALPAVDRFLPLSPVPVQQAHHSLVCHCEPPQSYAATGLFPRSHSCPALSTHKESQSF